MQPDSGGHPIEEKKGGGLIGALKTLAIGVVLLVVAACLAGYFLLPNDMHVEREVVIKGDKDEVFELLSDLKKWPEWSPWEKADPSIKITLGEKTNGVGASQSWTSKDGNGKLTLTQADPKTGIAYDFEFSGMKSKGQMRMEDAGDGQVKVKWIMDSKAGSAINLMERGFFAVGKGMIEPMFDDGLKRLKTAAEK